MPSLFHLAIGEGSSRKNARVQIGKAASQAPKLVKVTPQGEPVESARVHAAGSIPAEDLTSKALIDGDPEISLGLTGQILEEGTRAYYSPTTQGKGALKPEGGFSIKERITLPDGTVKEQAYTQKKSNTNDTNPVVAGKRMSATEAFRKLAFANHFLLGHSDGLQYEFLYGIAKELSDKKEVALLGAGPKGIQPLIFIDGGLPYRAYLYGEVSGDSYRLFVLLTNQELKKPDATPIPPAPTDAKPAAKPTTPAPAPTTPSHAKTLDL